VLQVRVLDRPRLTFRRRSRPLLAGTVLVALLGGGATAIATAASGASPASASAPRVAATAALASPGATTAGATAALAPEPLTGRLLVTLRPVAAHRGLAHTSAVETFLDRSGARQNGAAVPLLHMITVTPPRGMSAARFLARLRHDPAVEQVALERRFSYRQAPPAATYLPNDPALTALETAPGTPAGTPVEWWAQKEDFPEAWAVTKGQGAEVAVIDSGIDATNPEFAGKIDATNEVDSLGGDGPATTDLVGHGTHVSGLACAAGDNAIGIVGAGFDCHLIIEKSDLTESSVISCIIDATRRGADAINMSFGTDGSIPPPPQLAQAIK
jgi:serine protease